MEQDNNVNDIGIDSATIQPNGENKDEMSNSDDDFCSESDGTISEDSETEEPESKTKIFLTFIGCISLIAVFFTILGFIIYFVGKTSGGDSSKLQKQSFQKDLINNLAF